MPQLEQIPTFIGQVFWLVVTFTVLYFVLWRGAIPRIADILQERQERIDDDLQKAETLKREAEAALAAYEASAASAREDAQAILRAAAARFAEESARQHETLTGKLAEEAAAAEARIDAARAEALANVRAVAGDVARAATDKLVGIAVSEDEAEAAAAEALKGHA